MRRKPRKTARWILPSSISSRGPMRPCCCATWWTLKSASRISAELTILTTNLPRIYADSRGSQNRILSPGCSGLAVAADDRSAHFSGWIQHNNVGFRAGRKLSVLGEADGAGGIHCCGADRVLQTPASKFAYVPNGAVHGQDTAGEGSVTRALSIFHLDLNGTELVGAVGHAGCRHSVSNQDGAFKAHRPQENLNDLGREVNSIRDNVGAQLGVGKHFAKDSGIAMIQRTHGIEGVGGVGGAGVDSGAGGVQHRVRVADAHANLAPCCFGDDFESAGKLWCDGHHAHVAARSLPQTLKDSERGFDQVLRGMHAAALVAEKRTFQMDSEGLSMRRVAASVGNSSRCDGIGQPIQRCTGLIERRRDCRREVAGDAMRGQELVQMW